MQGDGDNDHFAPPSSERPSSSLDLNLLMPLLGSFFGKETPSARYFAKWFSTRILTSAAMLISCLAASILNTRWVLMGSSRRTAFNSTPDESTFLPSADRFRGTAILLPLSKCPR